MHIPHLFETFRLGERLFNTNQRKGRNKDSNTSVVVISDNIIPPHPLVYQCPPDFELNDWKTKKTLNIHNRSIEIESDINDVVDFEDMPGLDIEIVKHRQKLRKLKPEMLIKIKKEVKNEDVMTVLETPHDTKTWTVLFDGATNEVGHGVGAILTSPDGGPYPLTAKLYFDCTNNMAECEACNMGVQMAYDMKIKKLQ
ncbi:hypothetical protein Csa_007830, partial [Cucumis sativus]